MFGRMLKDRSNDRQHTREANPGRVGDRVYRRGRAGRAAAVGRARPGARPARPAQPAAVHHRAADRHGRADHRALQPCAARSPQTGLWGESQHRRVCRPGAAPGRLGRAVDHRAARRSRSTCGFTTTRSKLRPAGHLWGQADTYETQRIIRAETGRTAGAGGLHRAGRRERRALRRHPLRPRAAGGAHRHGRADGLQKPQGGGGARQRAHRYCAGLKRYTNRCASNRTSACSSRT